MVKIGKRKKGQFNIHLYFIQIVSLAKSLTRTVPKHQLKITHLKEEGFIIVGYCRKSVQQRKSKKLVHLLQSMVKNLYDRSLGDLVFCITHGQG